MCQLAQLRELRAALAQAITGLATVSEIAPDFVRLHERAEALAQKVQRFSGPCEPGAVRWLDAGNQLRLVESPLDIAQAVQEKLLTPVWSP